jgi:hypothetical protein
MMFAGAIIPDLSGFGGMGRINTSYVPLCPFVLARVILLICIVLFAHPRMSSAPKLVI